MSTEGEDTRIGIPGDSLVELLASALAKAGGIVIRVHGNRGQDRLDLLDHVYAWNQANARPLRQIVHAARGCKELPSSTDRMAVVEMIHPYLDFRFPVDVDLDLLVAFAKFVGPFALPDQPTLHLEPKGAEA